MSLHPVGGDRIVEEERVEDGGHPDTPDRRIRQTTDRNPLHAGDSAVIDVGQRHELDIVGSERFGHRGRRRTSPLISEPVASGHRHDGTALGSGALGIIAGGR